jgi:hypothetical protein
MRQSVGAIYWTEGIRAVVVLEEARGYEWCFFTEVRRTDKCILELDDRQAGVEGKRRQVYLGLVLVN